MTRQELEGKIDVLFGGRAAERLVFHEVSTGAQNDLQRATEIARAMVLEYGMGETLGPVTFPRRPSPFLEPPPYPADGKREYSEAIAQALDLETKKILEERLEHVLQLLQSKRQLLDRVAALLLEKEVVEAEEFARLVQEEAGVLSA
jgi:cell division protease FtsH